MCQECWVYPKIEAAVEAQREAVAVAEQIADEFLRLDALATCRINLGEALERTKRLTEAETVLRQALGDYRTLVGRFPDDIDYRWGLAIASTNFAAVVDQQGHPAEAIGLVEEAAKLFADLSPKLDKNEEFQGNRSKNEQLRQLIRRHLDSGKAATNPVR